MDQGKIKRKKALYDSSHRIVATWVSNDDYNFLQELAGRSQVRVSVYLRAIIVDALADEHNCANKSNVV